jgi:hypothetical protein
MDEDAPEFIEGDPLEAAIEIRNDIFKLKRGYRQNLYRCVARAYAVACAMASDKDAWAEFLEEDFWKHQRKKRPGVHSRNKALLHVMVFVFNATSKNKYDRAQKYAKALEKSFNEKIPAECIEDVIQENGGLEAMMRAASQKKRARASKDGSSSDIANDAVESDEEPEDGNERNESYDGEKSKPENEKTGSRQNDLEAMEKSITGRSLANTNL